MANNIARPILYFPLYQRPIIVQADINKNASFCALKEHVASKFPGTDAKRLIMAEIYKNRFFRMFEDDKSINEETITDNDVLAIMEVEHQPTNWPPPPKTIRKKSIYSQLSNADVDIPDYNSPAADEMVLSVFHRRPAMGHTRLSAGKQLFGAPMFITLDREEARNYDVILQKLIAKVSTMTSRDFLAEEVMSTFGSEDSNTVLMDAEDAEDAESDSKVQAESLESEDGMVDISMKDAKEASKTGPKVRNPASEDLPQMLQPGEKIPSSMRELFQISYLTTDNEMVPTGWGSLDDAARNLPKLESRIQPGDRRQKSNIERKGAMETINARLTRSSPQSSDEEVDDTPPLAQNQVRKDDSDSDGLPAVEQVITSKPKGKKSATTYSRKDQRAISRIQARQAPHNDEPLVRLGEALVLDWTDESYDALFGRSDDVDPDEDMRGGPTWDDMETHEDPELEQRKVTRTNRRKNGISLEDCLDEFGKPEILSENDAWYCPRCKEHRRASKKFELWKSPDILVIHLKRFSAHGRFRDKLDVRVDFPIEGLNLSGRVAIQEDKSQVYELFAVDNHYGGLGGGHYTAYAQNFVDKKWYEYNGRLTQPQDSFEPSN